MPLDIVDLRNFYRTPLGDAAHHPAVRRVHADGIVPFHKLSQWLTYSLIEPLQWAGIGVERLDGLTALAEYRNGGLLVDLGVIKPRKALDLTEKHAVTSELIVEWRALTVALLDEMLPASPHRPHERLIEFVTDRPGHDARYAIDAAKIDLAGLKAPPPAPSTCSTCGDDSSRPLVYGCCGCFTTFDTSPPSMTDPL